MSANVIEIDGLRKDYRRLRAGPSVAVDGLDLAVPEGGVFGFLGPNGSGKTTTIRCLLGLVRPSAGRVTLLGRPVPRGLAATMRRVGAIVEAPALFPTMTGRENLRLLATMDRIGPRRVDEVLAEVGLEQRAGDAVKRYSLGMRQRLGLAAALLKDPELLVLDEPANGLDPAGIREIRVLLRRLGGEGRTVFVSSHLLSEVEQICDSVAILRAGRCVAAGPVRQVLATAGPAAVVVRVDDLDAGCRVLARAGFTAERVGDHLRVDAPAGRGAAINRALAESGVWASELRCDDVTLEELFLRVTAETQEAAA